MLKTSSPAWRMWPEFSASIMAASSTSAPRAGLTRIAPRFIAAVRWRERKPRGSSVNSRCSGTTSPLAVHPRDPARGSPHQRDRGFGDSRVAISADQVNGDPELIEFFRIHVAARAGAQKYHVLETGAFARDLGRQRGVIDHRDAGAV